MMSDNVDSAVGEVLSETQANMLRLRELADSARSNIYERCMLASKVLDDKGWIAAFHSGDYFKAQKTLEDDYFFDLAGFISLGELVAIVKMFPDEDQWRDVKYRIGAMHAKWVIAKQAAANDEEGDNGQTKKSRNCATVKEREELRSQLEQTKRALAAIIGADEQVAIEKPLPPADESDPTNAEEPQPGDSTPKHHGKHVQLGLKETPRRTLADKVKDMLLALADTEILQIYNSPDVQKRNKKLKVAIVPIATKKK